MNYDQVRRSENTITYPKFRNAACMKKNMYGVKKLLGHVTLYNFYVSGAVAKLRFFQIR